jgi:hypothetical protein
MAVDVSCFTWSSVLQHKNSLKLDWKWDIQNNIEYGQTATAVQTDRHCPLSAPVPICGCLPQCWIAVVCPLSAPVPICGCLPQCRSAAVCPSADLRLSAPCLPQCRSAAVCPLSAPVLNCGCPPQNPFLFQTAECINFNFSTNLTDNLTISNNSHLISKLTFRAMFRADKQQTSSDPEAYSLDPSTLFY